MKKPVKAALEIFIPITIGKLLELIWQPHITFGIASAITLCLIAAIVASILWTNRRKRYQRMVNIFCLIGMLALGYVGGALVHVAQSPYPVIKITTAPADPPGPNMASKPIKGTISGVDSKECQVVVYAYDGRKWHIQPHEVPPSLIGVRQDGIWESETHGGTKFVALLVKPSYMPLPNPYSPPTVGGNVLAVSEEKQTK